jgi:hypothetical protein
VPTEIKLGDAPPSITIDVLLTARSSTDHAEGWAPSDVAIKLGAWSGHFRANFHALDFSTFLEGLRPLSATLRGVAALSSTDGYLDLSLVGDGLGHVAVTGEAWDRPRIGSHLEVSYEIDQTFLPRAIAVLEDVLREMRNAAG